MTLGMPRRLLRCALGAGAAALVAAGGTSVAAPARRPPRWSHPRGPPRDVQHPRRRRQRQRLRPRPHGRGDRRPRRRRRRPRGGGRPLGGPERLAGQRRRARQRLGMQSAFAPIYDLDPLAEGAPRRQYGVALLSRHPIVAVENPTYPALDPGSRPRAGPGTWLPRGDGADPRSPHHVYVTHLDYRGDPTVRSLQVRDTLRILGEDPEGANQVLSVTSTRGRGPRAAAPVGRLQDAWAVAPERAGAPG